MRRFTLFRLVAALILTIAPLAGTASAQDDDTLSISGTFGMDSMAGIVGEDLAYVFAEDNLHGWTLTLHGISYSYDHSWRERNDEFVYIYNEEYVTRVHATSFDFQFFGPDADILNEVVSGDLTAGSLTDGAFIELSNGYNEDSDFPDLRGSYSSFKIGLRPLDPAAGVSFDVDGAWDFDTSYVFDGDTDESDYPLVEPQHFEARLSTITDRRSGNTGHLSSYYDLVDLGSSEPPVLPPPLPTLSIADGSVLEGNKGTTRLDLTVTLSNVSSDMVTVNYATSNGTALAPSDYTATSGTLTFQPGETSRTISIAIKGDRKREPDETFSMQLDNPVGATIADGGATATILNDD